MATGSMQGSGKGRSAPGTPPKPVRKPGVRVVSKKDAAGLLRTSVIVSYGTDEVDVTGAMTGPLAHALWQLRMGEDIANWVDAERLLEQLLSQVATPLQTERGAPEVVVPRKRSRAAR